jgi:leucyl aminopeptidase
MYRQMTLAEGRGEAEAVAVFVYEKCPALPAAYERVDKRVGGVIAEALGREEFTAGRGEVAVLYPRQGARRVYVVGLGPRDKSHGDELRVAAAKLVKAAFAAKVKRLALEVALEGALSDAEAGEALAAGLSIAGFNFNRFKGAVNKKNGEKAIDLEVAVPARLRRAMEWGLAVGQGVTTARELSATPPNVANPAYLVEECRKVARDAGMRCEVIDAKRAKQLGMGGLVAVGGGSSHPPALICLEWDGAKKKAGVPKRQAKPILLVGKAVTFDTGGYSLKPSASMAGMKYDKCGGMTVIGAMQAIAKLGMNRRVVGLIPCAENMVDEKAYRLDDILTMCNGVTVEVTNTDAEGRLILADALAYGTKKYEPAAVIDVATLTGGVVVALGSHCAGMFCNDEGLRSKLETAAKVTGEKVWRLPLWEEHRQQMKGSHADLVNSADRKAHPIQGAAFLSYFVGAEAATKMPTLPWAHVDIAGVADAESDGPLYAKGPTGFGVRLLVQLVRRW